MSKSEFIRIPRLFTTAAGYHKKKLYFRIPKFSPVKKCTTFCKIYEQNMSKVYSGFFKGYFLANFNAYFGAKRFWLKMHAIINTYYR